MIPLLGILTETEKRTDNNECSLNCVFDPEILTVMELNVTKTTKCFICDPGQPSPTRDMNEESLQRKYNILYLVMIYSSLIGAWL